MNEQIQPQKATIKTLEDLLDFIGIMRTGELNKMEVARAKIGVIDEIINIVSSKIYALEDEIAAGGGES